MLKKQVELPSIIQFYVPYSTVKVTIFMNFYSGFMELSVHHYKFYIELY